MKLPTLQQFQNTILGQMCTVGGAISYALVALAIVIHLGGWVLGAMAS